MPTLASAHDEHDGRLAIVAALEALEVGDTNYAVEILLAALDDGPPRKLRATCRCGAGFEWVGLRDAHVAAGRCPSELADLLEAA